MTTTAERTTPPAAFPTSSSQGLMLRDRPRARAAGLRPDEDALVYLDPPVLVTLVSRSVRNLKRPPLKE